MGKSMLIVQCSGERALLMFASRGGGDLFYLLFVNYHWLFLARSRLSPYLACSTASCMCRTILTIAI